MYADTITDSMREAIDETNRRRSIQMAFNEEHGIRPKTVRKAINDISSFIAEAAEKKTLASATGRAVTRLGMASSSRHRPMAPALRKRPVLRRRRDSA